MSNDMRSRRFGSRLIHRLDTIAAKPAVALWVLSLDAVWLVSSAIFGFPTRVEAIFQTLVAALTLASVFVLQHTQTRQEAVTQRKLDEILRALPDADNALVNLEDASDPELRHVHDRHRAIRTNARR